MVLGGYLKDIYDKFQPFLWLKLEEKKEKEYIFLKK